MKMSSNKQARTTAFGSPIRGSPDRISPFIQTAYDNSTFKNRNNTVFDSKDVDDYKTGTSASNPVKRNEYPYELSKKVKDKNESGFTHSLIGGDKSPFKGGMAFLNNGRNVANTSKISNASKTQAGFNQSPNAKNFDLLKY